jgi:hypothetical protein
MKKAAPYEAAFFCLLSDPVQKVYWASSERMSTLEL